MNGCIEHVKLDNRLMDLSKSRTAKGVQLGCNARNVRVISMVSERSTATFSSFSAKKDYLELTFRFKTKRPSGILASVISDEQVSFKNVPKATRTNTKCVTLTADISLEANSAL